MSRTIAILLFPGVEELDFAGPWEIFSYLRSLEPDTCTVFTVSEKGGEIRCAKGLRVIADYSLESAPRADILVVPGGMGTRTEVDNPALVGFIRGTAETAEVVTSVCTGSFLLERAGLLDGKRATTHWRSLDRLRALGSVQVVEERWVDEGKIVTSSGVSAGIDMALYVIGRLWDPATARRVQKGVEYFPDPPYADHENSALIRRYYEELWNRWDLALVDEILASDIRFRGSLGVTVHGHDGFKEYLTMVRTAFPDFHNTIEELITDGDRVVVRLTYRGTHRGELFGIAPTGRQATYEGMASFRVEGGQIVEGWVMGNTQGLMQQLTSPSALGESHRGG